jgi:hypothetical protein
MPDRGRGWLLGAAVVSLLLVVSIRFDLVPWVRGPAPYPPEWQWRYRPHALARAMPAVPIGLGLVALLAWSGSALARRRPRRAAASVMAGAVLLGFAFPLALLQGEDGGAIAFLVSRSSSPAYLSYHAVARSEAARDVRALLRDYPRLLPTLPEHAATHPPGPILIYRGLMEGLARWPGLEAPLRRQVERACGTDGSRCSAAVAQETPVERSAALAGALLAHSAAVLVLVPIGWFAFRLNRDPLSAARVAAVWPLVPGAALFIPELDPMLALPIFGALATLRLGLCGARTWTRIAGAVLSGSAAAVAALLSYGAALLIPLGALPLVAGLPRHVLTRARIVPALVGGAAAFAAITAIPMAFGYAPLRSALVATAIHRESFTAHRSYRLWLAFGPLDFALFLGAPVAIGLLAHTVRGIRSLGPHGRVSPPARQTIGFVGALLLLVVSGLVRGEIGRILVPWMPLALISGLVRLDEEPGPDAATAAVTAALLVLLDITLRLSWRL